MRSRLVTPKTFDDEVTFQDWDHGLNRLGVYLESRFSRTLYNAACVCHNKKANLLDLFSFCYFFMHVHLEHSASAILFRFAVWSVGVGSYTCGLQHNALCRKIGTVPDLHVPDAQRVMQTKSCCTGRLEEHFSIDSTRAMSRFVSCCEVDADSYE